MVILKEKLHIKVFAKTPKAKQPKVSDAGYSIIFDLENNSFLRLGLSTDKTQQQKGFLFAKV